MTAPDRRPWDAPPSAALDALAQGVAASVAASVAAAYRDGYADGWLTCRREALAQAGAAERQVMEMRTEAAGEAARVAYLRAEVDRLAPEAAQARTLADALALAEGEVASLRREVAHLKRLAGLPEGM